jgi:hypothetical protein
MNFFRPECRSGPFTSETFGICDNQDGTPAYVDTNTKNNNKWIAIVKNSDKLEIIFTAIDKCILKDVESIGRKRCDGMLTTDIHLYLVELKDKLRTVSSDAIQQLKSTIEMMKEDDINNIAQFKNKKAFICNRRHPKFAVIDNETKLKFFNETTFRLDIQAEIMIF